MHLFSNLCSDPKQELLAKAKRKGMTVEEYQEWSRRRWQEREEKEREECQRRHKEELQRLGMTEEQYQKKIEKEAKIRETFGWIATGLTMFLYINIVLPYLNLIKGKINYEETPGIIVTANYINCFCWYIYGDMIYSYQIEYCNLIGAILFLIMMCIYLVYELKKYPIDAILNSIMIVTGTYAAYRALTILIEDDDILGRIVVGTSCGVLLSSVQLIYKVIKEKNYNLIPIHSTYISIGATFCWIGYGVLTTDLYVIFPYLIGLILSIIQIIIFFNFKKRYFTIGEKQFASTIGIESNGNDNENKENINKDEDDLQRNMKEKPVKIVEKDNK